MLFLLYYRTRKPRKNTTTGWCSKEPEGPEDAPEMTPNEGISEAPETTPNEGTSEAPPSPVISPKKRPFAKKLTPKKRKTA